MFGDKNKCSTVFEIREIQFVIESAKDYPIVIDCGLREQLGIKLRSVIDEGRNLVVVTDDGVPCVIVEQVLESLANAGWGDVETIVFPAGEPSKSIETFRQITTRLIELGVDRRSVLVALGGGVVSDTAGYVAASFMRGIDYVVLPTTVIGQLDAAVGGKVAVNHPSGKNLIGAFWHPLAVLIDPVFLRTLPLVEVRNGLAEALKVAIIGSPELFDFLEKHSQALATKNPDIDGMAEVIDLAVVKKVQLLLPDPFENDLRRVLNLGHTFAHALETRGAYSLRHGFAVAIGIALATRISLNRRAIKSRDADRIFNVLRKLGLPTGGIDIDPADVWRHTHVIRRIRGNSLNYVLPTSVKSVEIVNDLGFEEFAEAFSSLEPDTDVFQQAYLSAVTPG